MTDGHCFISYTNAKTEQVAIQLATKLADRLKGEPPNIDVWIDNRSIHAGNWDEQVSEAIKNCKCVLFIVSPDSVTSNSICADEIDWALKYKKTIIPLIAYQNAEIPFRLSRRKFIDFTGDFETALSQLRNLLVWLDTPEGELQKLNDRLSDAQRDLRRNPEQTARIEKEIEELKSQIQVQENIVKNPQAAQEQTQKNIEAGLERERKPQIPLVGIQSSKFINPPPGIAPNYFQDRTVETKQVLDFLHDDAQRLMTVVGRGGVGKTAMICRLLKHLENDAVPDDVLKAFPDIKPIKVDGIIYLSESGSHRVNFANIFYDLCKLLPKETAQELDAIYKNPQGSTESKVHNLLEKFTEGRIVLLLDNFEPLVNTETFEIQDTELNEALHAFLNGPHTEVNIIITTRIAPKALNLIQPGRQRPLDLDDGLISPYAENILREMDSDGRLGLKSASNELLNTARIRTQGYPRALEALFAILASDRYTTLEEILNTAEHYLPETVVRDLVGEAFNRLDTNAQKVMQALAVYNRPVTPAAVDYLLAPHIPAMDSAPILQRLASMHFARKESGRFYLHPVDREFAYNLIPEGEKVLEEPEDSEFDFDEKPDIVEEEIEDTKEAFEEDDENDDDETSDINFDEVDFESLFKNIKHSRIDFTRYGLLDRAADFFAQARKPRAEWKKLEDLSAQLAEFDLRYAAGDYDTAASVLIEIDFDYLLLWGHFRLVIQLHEKLQGKILDATLQRISVANLGIANGEIGLHQSAIKYYEQVLVLARQNYDRQHEGAILGNLGRAYDSLGEAHKAINYYEQALVIAREIGDRRGEGARLSNLGSTYRSLGETRQALEYQQQALAIFQEIGDKSNEGIISSNIGNRYLELSEDQTALEYYRRASDISSQIGDQSSKSSHLENIGHALVNLGRIIEAQKSFQEAINIADDISYLLTQNMARCGLAEAYLLQNNLVNARATIEAALQYDVPQNNHNASALHGIIALRQGDEVAARAAFVRAIGQADEILSKTAEFYEALDAKGLAMCGLALCARDDGRQTVDGGNGQPSTVYRQQAIETFQKARKIAPHAGIVKQNLRLFDELVKCEGGEILKDVRSAVEGVA